MTISSRVELQVEVPTLADFGARYRQYGSRAAGVGKPLYDLVMCPETFVAAAVVTDRLGLPAVAAIAEEVSSLLGGAMQSIDKQFVGALICSLMLANGYVKTGRKRAIPQKGWSKGEVYALPDGGSGLTFKPVSRQ